MRSSTSGGGGGGCRPLPSPLPVQSQHLADPRICTHQNPQERVKNRSPRGALLGAVTCLHTRRFTKSRPDSCRFFSKTVARQSPDNRPRNWKGNVRLFNPLRLSPGYIQKSGPNALSKRTHIHAYGRTEVGRWNHHIGS